MIKVYVFFPGILRYLFLPITISFLLFWQLLVSHDSIITQVVRSILLWLEGIIAIL
jgi:hypothetical protein